MTLSRSDLDMFTGTDEWFRHPLGVLYTTGARFLFENAKCWWLLDVIASYQPDPRVRRNQRLQEFQLWTITVDGTKGLVQLREDSGLQPVLEQEVEYTDLEIPAGMHSLKLYVENNTVLLPSEH